MDKTRRPTRSSDDRKGDIARAALKVLQTEGYAALTARKIAAEADISLGHISYNFTGMDEVLSHAYRLASAQLREATVATVNQSKNDPIGRIRAFLHAGFTPDFLAPEHLRMRIDLWSAALTHPEIAETERGLYQRYRDDLDALLTAAAAPDKIRQVAAVSDTIMATLDGLWLDWMRRRDAQAVQNGLAMCEYLATALLTR